MVEGTAFKGNLISVIFLGELFCNDFSFSIRELVGWTNEAGHSGRGNGAIHVDNSYLRRKSTSYLSVEISIERTCSRKEGRTRIRGYEFRFRSWSGASCRHAKTSIVQGKRVTFKAFVQHVVLTRNVSVQRKIRPPSPPPLDDDDSRRRMRDSDDEGVNCQLLPYFALIYI